MKLGWKDVLAIAAGFVIAQFAEKALERYFWPRVFADRQFGGIE